MCGFIMYIQLFTRLHTAFIIMMMKSNQHTASNEYNCPVNNVAELILTWVKTRIPVGADGAAAAPVSLSLPPSLPG